MIESSSYSCPRCNYRIRTLSDEVGDHGCPRCRWEPYDDPDTDIDVEEAD